MPQSLPDIGRCQHPFLVDTWWLKIRLGARLPVPLSSIRTLSDSLPQINLGVHGGTQLDPHSGAQRINPEFIVASNFRIIHEQYFSGMENAAEFLENIDNNLTYYEIPTQLACAYLKGHLTGRALDWFEVLGYRVVEDRATDYAHLKQALTEQFPVVRNRSELETRFYASCQKVLFWFTLPVKVITDDKKKFKKRKIKKDSVEDFVFPTSPSNSEPVEIANNFSDLTVDQNQVIEEKEAKIADIPNPRPLQPIHLKITKNFRNQIKSIYQKFPETTNKTSGKFLKLFSKDAEERRQPSSTPLVPASQTPPTITYQVAIPSQPQYKIEDGGINRFQFLVQYSSIRSRDINKTHEWEKHI
ncbi:uncharacterized protein TNCV_81221 [Trichonephila clavipes]|nr:uncharacterized protein TNCV_81221 [Trichonephila clavipes]